MDSEMRKWERLHRFLAQDDWDQTVYVYQIDTTGRKITPYLAKMPMHSYLLETIKERFGTGEYHLMIREGSTMLFSGTIGVQCPIRHDN